MKRLLAPSILSADFNYLHKDVMLINTSNADWFHVDVMDGVFVPNISFGFPILQHVKKIAQKPLDVHLMIVQPDRYLQEFAEAGADVITVHLEACTHIHRTLQSIRSLGLKAGVAINPGTPVHALDAVLSDADLFLVMSVNPGFGGQKFIENTYNKCSDLKNLIIQKNSNCLIEIDGGVNEITAPKLLNAGANVLVAGNYVFSSSNPTATIASLKAL